MKYPLFILLLGSSLLWAQPNERKFSLYFEHNAYQLTLEHHLRLDSLKQLPSKDELDIHIRGYTNSIGTESYNLRLSGRRAENVKAQLREFTIISSVGYGELSGQSADNRRVDILVHRKVDHIPEAGEVIEAPTATQERLPSIKGLVNPKKGDKMTLEGIMFYSDRDVIMDESKEALEELLAFLEQNPRVRFKLIGHICCGDWENPGRDLKNVRTGQRNLSEARAQSLRNYLVKKGIDKRRIRYVGMAYRSPTGKGDQFDRRVEIEITSVD